MSQEKPDLGKRLERLKKDLYATHKPYSLGWARDGSRRAKSPSHLPDIRTRRRAENQLKDIIDKAIIDINLQNEREARKAREEGFRCRGRMDTYGDPNYSPRWDCLTVTAIAVPVLVAAGYGIYRLVKHLIE